MKLATSGVVIASTMVVFFAVPLTHAAGQDNQNGELKHLLVTPDNGGRPVSLTALNIERGTSYPSVVRMQGKVEIRTPFCIGEGPKLVCDGETVVRADRAEFHEDNGEIEAHGEVSVTPRLHR